MKAFTVIGHYDENSQLFMHHVFAKDVNAAYAAVAKDHSDVFFTGVLDGHVDEFKGITLCGFSLIHASTVIDNPDVYGTGEPVPFKDISAEDLTEWMEFARSAAEDRGTPIGENCHEEAEDQAKNCYEELSGVLPQTPEQGISAIELKKFMDQVSLQATGCDPKLLWMLEESAVNEEPGDVRSILDEILPNVEYGVGRYISCLFNIYSFSMKRTTWLEFTTHDGWTCDE